MKNEAERGLSPSSNNTAEILQLIALKKYATKKKRSLMKEVFGQLGEEEPKTLDEVKNMVDPPLQYIDERYISAFGGPQVDSNKNIYLYFSDPISVGSFKTKEFGIVEYVECEASEAYYEKNDDYYLSAEEKGGIEAKLEHKPTARNFVFYYKKNDRIEKKEVEINYYWDRYGFINEEEIERLGNISKEGAKKIFEIYL